MANKTSYKDKFKRQLIGYKEGFKNIKFTPTLSLMAFMKLFQKHYSF